MFNYICVNQDNQMIQGIVQVSDELMDSPNYLRVRYYDPSLAGRKFVSINAEGDPVCTDMPAPDPADDPRFWWIDVGPFYDRFGPDALAIAASDHGACKAVQTLTGVRKYIDLKDPRIGQMIDMLIAVGQPAAQTFAPGSGPMTAAKKAAILTTPPTERERHVKGLGEVA